MASPVVATPGAADANSYLTLVEARGYYGDFPYATDAQLQDDTKLAQALITATQLIDDGWDFEGMSTTYTQARAFPRIGGSSYFADLGYAALTDVNGRPIGSDEIPDGLKRATAELARQLLQSDRTADSDIETQGISSVKAGSVEVAFRSTATAKVFPDRVITILSRWGVQRGSKSYRRLSR